MRAAPALMATPGDDRLSVRHQGAEKSLGKPLAYFTLAAGIGYLLMMRRTSPGSLCGFRSWLVPLFGAPLPPATTKKNPSLKPPP